MKENKIKLGDDSDLDPYPKYKEMNKRQKDLLGFRYHPPLDEFTGNRSIQKKHIKPVNYNLPK